MHVMNTKQMQRESEEGQIVVQEEMHLCSERMIQLIIPLEYKRNSAC